MRDSGQTWLGLIPSSWGLARIGSLYSHRNERVSDKDYPPLSVTMKGVVPQLETAAKTDDGDNRKLVKIGDFAINSRSDRRGSCGISMYDGSVSLINTVLTPRGQISPKYYDWLFHTVEFADEYYKWGHGIVDDLWTTRWQEMKRILVPVPSIDEQVSIASFLEKQVSLIDSIIEDSKRSIEDYKKYKASTIEELVLGQNRKGQIKESGVEWVKEIPSDWHIARLKSLFGFGKGLPITKEDLIDSGISVISYGQIHAKSNPGTRIVDDLIRYVPETYLKTNKESLANKGDIILADTSEDTDGCGNAVYIDQEVLLFAGYHTILLKSLGQKDNKYLAYLMKSDAWRSQIRSRVTGVKLFSISKKILSMTTVILPPEKERIRITNDLDEKCRKIDLIIQEKERLLQNLEEYKRSLIFEAVTGKIRVK